MTLGDEQFTSNPEQFQTHSLGNLNVAESERWPSIVGGALLALLGLGRRSLLGTLMAVVGGILLYRGTTAHCPVYQSLGISTYHPGGMGASEIKPGRVAVKPNRSEPVEEASWESFPASDSPSWSGGAIT